MNRTGAITRFLSLVSIAILFFATATWVAAQSSTDTSSNDQASTTSNNGVNSQSDIEKRIKNAADVLDEVMGQKDKAIPAKIMGEAQCVAIVPSMFKVAFGFGGSHGKGVATCRTNGRWSAPAPFSITGGSWGLQIGAQSVDLIMLVMNKKGMDALLSNKFKIGADASAAAGPVGRQGEASTDWKMKAEVLTYSRARGVFAGIDLSGAKISQDADETRILYGKMVPFATILNGNVAAPSGAQPFLAAVRKYATVAKEQGSLTTPTTSATPATANNTVR